MRIANVCTNDKETSVLAHFSVIGAFGMGLKADDRIAGICCSACHDVLDNPGKDPDFEESRWEYITRSISETHIMMMEAGLFTLPIRDMSGQKEIYSESRAAYFLFKLWQEARSEAFKLDLKDVGLPEDIKEMALELMKEHGK
jgi:hypothetical protein